MAVHTSPNPGKITTDLIAKLALDTGKAIGDAISPYEGLPIDPSQFGHAIVTYVTPSLIADSPNTMTPDTERYLTYQVTSVGQERDQCDDMAQLVRNAILDRTDDLVSWRVVLGADDTAVIDRTFNNGSGTRRVDGGLYNCADRYQLTVAVLP